MANSGDLDAARYVLEQWARWMLCGGGYSHSSSIDQFRDGFGISSGTFGGRLPIDVEPGMLVRSASRAMQHLRVLDGRAAELLARLYLEQEPLMSLAERDEVSLSQIKDRRRAAERSFYSLYAEIRFHGNNHLSLR